MAFQNSSSQGSLAVAQSLLLRHGWYNCLRSVLTDLPESDGETPEPLTSEQSGLESLEEDIELKIEKRELASTN